MGNYVDRFLAKLTGVENVGAGEWSASSPLRDEVNPSLRVSLTQDGRILVRDFGGAATRDVLKAMGLTFQDLYPPWFEDPVPGRDRASNTSEGGLPSTRHHDVYSRFLQELPGLTSHDKDGLMERGVSPEMFRNLGYRSLTWFDGVRAAQSLMQHYQKDALLSVPGFKLDKGRTVPVMTDGLLIPVRHPNGEIVGLKVRLDNGPQKYRWFAGAGSNPINAACHTSLSDFTPCHKAVVVEGPIKADVVARKVAARVLGIPGVSSWRTCIPVLQHLAPERVCVALDSDWQMNPSVASALIDMLQDLQRLHVVRVAVWDPKNGKGLDDLLKAEGAEPDYIDAQSAITRAHEVVVKYKGTRDEAVTWPSTDRPSSGSMAKSTPKGTSPVLTSMVNNALKLCPKDRLELIKVLQEETK